MKAALPAPYAVGREWERELMHPRLQEVQFLDSKGKPLSARQREVVAEAFSGWFEEKILPRLDGTSGPIVG